MAANLARAGYALTVWTHTPGKAERWAAEHGATAAGDARPRSPRASDIVVSMVVDGEQVASVLLGEQGVIDGGPAGPAVRRHVDDRPAPTPGGSAPRWRERGVRHARRARDRLLARAPRTAR